MLKYNWVIFVKIKNLMEELFKWSPINRENHSDIPVFGDTERDVKKIAVCLIATPDVLKKAKSIGAEFILTHEPTFHDSIIGYKDEETFTKDAVAVKKKEMIEKLDIPIYRFHDYSHFTDVDKIHMGFVKNLGLKGVFDGKRTLTLDTPITISKLEKELCEKLDLKHLRFVGNREKEVKTISLCLGSWGNTCLYDELNREEIDCVICGEICEWTILEYVRDANQLGIDKSLFVAGHMSSERSGMKYVAEYINENINGVTAIYIDCEEVYN